MEILIHSLNRPKMYKRRQILLQNGCSDHHFTATQYIILGSNSRSTIICSTPWLTYLLLLSAHALIHSHRSFKYPFSMSSLESVGEKGAIPSTAMPAYYRLATSQEIIFHPSYQTNTCYLYSNQSLGIIIPEHIEEVSPYPTISYQDPTLNRDAICETIKSVDSGDTAHITNREAMVWTRDVTDAAGVQGRNHVAKTLQDFGALVPGQAGSGHGEAGTLPFHYDEDKACKHTDGASPHSNTFAQHGKSTSFEDQDHNLVQGYDGTAHDDYDINHHHQHHQNFRDLIDDAFDDAFSNNDSSLQEANHDSAAQEFILTGIGAQFDDAITEYSQPDIPRVWEYLRNETSHVASQGRD